MNEAEAAMTVVRQALSAPRIILSLWGVRRMNEAEAASAPAMTLVRQALSALRIILSP